MIDKLQLPFGGPISIGYIDDISKIWTPLQEKDHNLILYGAADILAKLAANHVEYAIAGMYFEFSNGVPPTITNTDRSITTTYYTGLSAPDDYIRVAIDATPVLTPSSVNYAGNVATFFASTAGTVGQHGVAFNQASTSTVHGGALVATPTNSAADDILFARFYFTTPVAKLNGSQIGVKWSVQFN